MPAASWPGSVAEEVVVARGGVDRDFVRLPRIGVDVDIEVLQTGILVVGDGEVMQRDAMIDDVDLDILVGRDGQHVRLVEDVVLAQLHSSHWSSRTRLPSATASHPALRRRRSPVPTTVSAATTATATCRPKPFFSCKPLAFVHHFPPQRRRPRRATSGRAACAGQ